jgi:hypothetical protein
MTNAQYANENLTIHLKVKDNAFTAQGVETELGTRRDSGARYRSLPSSRIKGAHRAALV